MDEKEKKFFLLQIRNFALSHFSCCYFFSSKEKDFTKEEYLSGYKFLFKDLTKENFVSSFLLFFFDLPEVFFSFLEKISCLSEEEKRKFLEECQDKPHNSKLFLEMSGKKELKSELFLLCLGNLVKFCDCPIASKDLKVFLDKHRKEKLWFDELCDLACKEKKPNLSLYTKKKRSRMSIISSLPELNWEENSEDNIGDPGGVDDEPIIKETNYGSEEENNSFYFSSSLTTAGSSVGAVLSNSFGVASEAAGSLREGARKTAKRSGELINSAIKLVGEGVIETTKKRFSDLCFSNAATVQANKRVGARKKKSNVRLFQPYLLRNVNPSTESNHINLNLLREEKKREELRRDIKNFFSSCKDKFK